MSASDAYLDVDLPVQLERNSVHSLQRQLIEQLRQAILSGKLTPGTRLPSTRALAAVLHVSRNVTFAAYEELFAQGYLEGRQGSGTYVCRDLPALPAVSTPTLHGTARWLRKTPVPAGDEGPAREKGIEFRLGMPSVSSLPLSAWRTAWREVEQLPPQDYADPAGDPLLRAALASYLGRSRGLSCRPDDIIITSGTVQALDLIIRATMMPTDAIAFEEPGYPLARRIAQSLEAQIVSVPVDDDGLMVHSLPSGPEAPLLVYVTPSHQYPLAVRLSVTRRLALLQWAQENDSLIIEDDYDSEFRFDAPPLPALAGLDSRGHVVYTGTFSKVLAPSLRVGYLVAPPPLRERIERLKFLTDYHTSWPVQRMLAIFLQEGHLDRHIRRMRREYARKRALLKSMLAPLAPYACLQGLEAGLHAYLDLHPALDAARIITLAREQGVIVTSLNRYYAGIPDRNGLLLGYGGLELADIAKGAHILACVIQQEVDSKL